MRERMSKPHPPEVCGLEGQTDTKCEWGIIQCDQGHHRAAVNSSGVAEEGMVAPAEVTPNQLATRSLWWLHQHGFPDIEPVS